MPGWRMGGHGRDHPYRICWRSWRVAIRRGFRKKWAVWDQEKTASLLYPVGRDGEWEDMAHGRDHPAGEEQSAKDFEKNRRSGIRRRWHLSYTLWVGMENGKTWPMAETILSYLLAEPESSNPQRISKKIGGTDIEAKALFLLLWRASSRGFPAWSSETEIAP